MEQIQNVPPLPPYNKTTLLFGNAVLQHNLQEPEAIANSRHVRKSVMSSMQTQLVV
jgi:hypothetical protein